MFTRRLRNAVRLANLKAIIEAFMMKRITFKYGRRNRHNAKRMRITEASRKIINEAVYNVINETYRKGIHDAIDNAIANIITDDTYVTDGTKDTEVTEAERNEIHEVVDNAIIEALRNAERKSY
jgi:predicted subunit of tRNA(5-methylaminomethyl-2-thiouridylate) methyltransferase